MAFVEEKRSEEEKDFKVNMSRVSFVKFSVEVFS